MSEYERKNREAINKLIENNNLLVKHNQDLVNKVSVLETELQLIKATIKGKTEKSEEKKPLEQPTPQPVIPTSPTPTVVPAPEPKKEEVKTT